MTAPLSVKPAALHAYSRTARAVATAKGLTPRQLARTPRLGTSSKAPLPLLDVMDPSPAGAITTTVLLPEHVAGTARVLSHAFFEDPFTKYFFPKDATRRETLELVFDDMARDAQQFGGSTVALRDGQVVGAGLWLPPGKYPVTAERRAAGAGNYLRLSLRELKNLPRMIRAQALVDKGHPHETPHWYLLSVGVAPDAQGHGLGSKLLRPQLAKLDALGQPAYLETSNEDNLGLYQHLGFQLTRRDDVGRGAPPVFRMWRAPQPPVDSMG